MGIVGLYSTGYGEILEVDESLVAQYVALGWLPISGGGGGGVTDSAVAGFVTSGAQTKAALDGAYSATVQTVATVTSAATLAGDKHTPVDATSGPLTMTLPTPARIGQQVRVEKVDSSANAVTVSGTLRGATSTVVMPFQYEVRTFIAESLSSWRVASGNTPKTALDATYAQKRLTRALVKMYGGIANRLVAPCRLAFLGSSTTAGQNATIAANRYVDRLVLALQSAYPSGTGNETTVVASTTADWGSLSSAAGVHGYNAGRGGAQVADYVDSTTRPKIAALQPSMVLHMIGANDYREGVAVATFKATLSSQVSQLKSAISKPCAHLLVAPYPRATTGGNPVAPWSAYAAAMGEIALADPDNVAFLDLSEDYALLGFPGADPLNLLDTDDVHQTDAGHAYMADTLRRQIGIVQIGGVAPVLVSQPTALSLTATPGDGQVTTAATGGSGATSYALYRSSTVTGSPIATGSSLSAINITDTGRTNGTPVSYVATATNAQGTVTSNSVTVTPQAAGAGGYNYTTDSALLGEWDGDNLVTAGSQITTWSKRRGSWTTDFTQPTASFKPTVSSSAQMLNGRNTVQFDGSDYLGLTPNTVVAGPYTIFTVFRSTATSTTRLFGSDQTSKYALMQINSGPGQLVMSNGAGTTGQTTTSISSPGSPAVNAAHIVAGVYNGGSSALYLDALTPTTGAVLTGDGTELTNLRLGATPTPGNYLNGQMAHFLVIGRALSSSEVAAVLQALASRYGLTLGA